MTLHSPMTTQTVAWSAATTHQFCNGRPSAVWRSPRTRPSAVTWVFRVRPHDDVIAAASITAAAAQNIAPPTVEET
jgi:hypothetical protein